MIGADAAQDQELLLDEIGESYGSLRLVNPRAEKQMQESLERYGQISPAVVARRGMWIFISSISKSVEC